MLCRHCQRCQPHRRGLCWSCYQRPEVRSQYQPTSKYGIKHEPSEAEVERTIAEQLANLPPWWGRSQRRYREMGEDD